MMSKLSKSIPARLRTLVGSESAAGPVDAGIYADTAVKGLFQRMSRSYEWMNIVMSFGFSAWWRRALMLMVPEQPAGSRVVDAMCGMGETWRCLVKRFPDSKFDAVDFTPAMVEEARSKSAQQYDGRVNVKCEDMLESSFKDSSVDVVVSAFGLKTFDEHQSALFAEELVRVLKPGGRFAFIEIAEPTNDVLRAVYGFYLSKVVPTLGRLFMADPEEYRMLFQYVQAYGQGDRSWDAFASQPGLVVERREHFFGCAVSFHGQVLPTKHD